MNIIVFNEKFETMGSIGVFNTLIWDRRYYEAGVFELHAPVEYFQLLNENRYIFRNDRPELGVIREVNFTNDDSGQRLAYCKGYFAESLLDLRVIEKTFNMSGTAEAIARAVIDKFIVSPTDEGRRIAHIALGPVNGVGTSTRLQVTGDNVGEKLYDFLKTQEASQRLTFDFINNVLSYEVWKGLDRTQEQTENSWATFSDSFYNVKSVVYARDESTAKNYAYVAGEGEGDARKIVEIDLRESASEERKEVYVDARDLQASYYDDAGTEHRYSDAEYSEMLRQRGLEKLAEYAMVETIDSDIDSQANLVYGQDFDLGDLCTYQNFEIGLELNKRITGIQEVYEGSKQTISITFGNDDATSIKKIIKREVS